MMPFDRLLMIQAASVVSAILAGIVGGLLAGNWVWAVACAVVVYGLAGAVAMVWMARRLRSRRGGIGFDRDWLDE